MKGWYKTSGGYDIKYELYNRKGNYLSCCDIIELVIPDGVKEVYCSNNNLTELIIPDQVEYIDCDDNQLTKLDIPDSVK
jgi:hypothetical protein